MLKNRTHPYSNDLFRFFVKVRRLCGGIGGVGGCRVGLGMGGGGRMGKEWALPLSDWLNQGVSVAACLLEGES